VQLTNTEIQSNLRAIANDTPAILTISASAVKALKPRDLDGYATNQKTNVTEIALAEHQKALRHRHRHWQ